MKLYTLCVLVLSLFHLSKNDTTWKLIDDVSSSSMKELIDYASEETAKIFPNYPFQFINAYYLHYFGDNYYFVFAVFNEKEKELFFYLVFIEMNDDVGESEMKIYQKYIEKKTRNIDMHHHYYILFQPIVIDYLYENEHVLMNYITDIQQYHNCFAITVKANNECEYYLAGWKNVNDKTNDTVSIKALFKLKK